MATMLADKPRKTTPTNVRLARRRFIVYRGRMSEGSNRAAPRYEADSSILGTLVRNLISLFFVGVSVMCVYNVFGVGGEVEAMAKETACQGQPLPCTAQYTQQQRTPWVHAFKMHTSATSGAKDIDCRREYILVGAYSCKVVGAESAGIAVTDVASSPAKPAPSVQIRFPPKVKPAAAPKPQPAPSAAAPAETQ